VLVKVHDRKLLNQSWLDRKLYRASFKANHRQWRKQELAQYGMTLHGARKDDAFIWL
jgi:hypothetical protein